MSYASITRSSRGVEQHSRILRAAISRGLMPPLWDMSTEPLTRVDLHVPHTPSPHDDGSVRPASNAASRMNVPGLHATVRPERANSTENAAPGTGPSDSAASGAPASLSNVKLSS